MRRGTLAGLVWAHVPADDDEAAHRLAVLELLASVADPFRRYTMDPGHITASGFVLSPDGRSLLLIRHRILGMWLQPGGHVEARDEDIFAASRREVLEETGLEQVVLEPGWPEILDLDVHAIPSNPRKGEGAHLHHDVRLLWRATTWEVEQTDEVDGVRWVPLEELATVETDASVRRAASRILGRARRRDASDVAHAPAPERNGPALARVLSRWLPAKARVLEVGSGTGQHARRFAGHPAVAHWQSTEREGARLDMLCRALEGADVPPPRRLDAARGRWHGVDEERWDAVVCCNVIHIAPWRVAEGLIRGAARVVDRGGRLLVYGPMRALGAHTAPSNAAFEASLRSRDPSWGVRDVERVVKAASRHGWAWEATEPMPANNVTLVFRRTVGGTPWCEAEADALLDRWFGKDRMPDRAWQDRWWTTDAADDRALAERFGHLLDDVDEACAGWSGTPQGVVAELLVRDQLPRQVFRDTPDAFREADRAEALAAAALADEVTASLPPFLRLFALMPMMHAEDLAAQHVSVAAIRDLAAEHPELAGHLSHALAHRVPVARFGRFPHRNAVLGRASTDEEARYLTTPGEGFGRPSVS